MWRNPDSTTDSMTVPLREPYVLLFLAFVTLGVYYPAVLSGFCTMDDIIGITSLLNSSAKGLPRLLGFGVAGFYRRPLSNLVRYGLYLMSGEQPLLFHLFNVLLHLGCGLVVYYLVKGRLKAGIPASWPALVAALLFLLHPLNVEAVAWMSGHCAVMASFFALLAFYYHQRVQVPGTDWRLWLAGGLYLLSLLSYELAAAMPLAFIGRDLLEQRDLGWREATRKSYKRWIPYGVVFFVYLLYWGLSQWSSREISQITGGGSPSIFDARFLLKLVANPLIGLGFYFKKTIIPWPLNFHIGTVDKIPYFLLGVGCLLLLGIALRRRSWWAAWGWAFVCSLLPILSLTVYSHSWTCLAERYAYLGSGFFAICVGLFFAKLPVSRQGALGYAFRLLPLLALLVAGYSTANRVLVWQDDESLLADTLEKSPTDGWVAYSYACVVHRMKKYEEAERYMKRAYDLGFVAQSALILGGLEENRGDYEKAERYYLEAAWPSAEVRRMSRNCAPEVYAALGNLHWKWAKSDPKRAAHHRERVIHFFGRAYEFSSKDPWILYNLGKFYLEQGMVPEAQECFRTVHEKVPDTYYGEAAGKLMLVESPSNKERPDF